MSRKVLASGAMAALGAAMLIAAAFAGPASSKSSRPSASGQKKGGTMNINASATDVDYIDPTLATPLLSGMGAKPAGLTGDERTLMRMLADGLTTEDIAVALSASRTTAQTRIADVMRKLNADTRAQAVGVAIRDGWIV